MNRKYCLKTLIFFIFLEGFFPFIRGDLPPAGSAPCSVAQIPSPNCSTPHQNANLKKISFDLDAISPEGLIGQENGLRSQSYEFCVPDQANILTEVKAIDPSLKLYRSRGRIGCRNDQWLAIGETHQPNWKQILLNLAHLDYIERINPFWGE